MASDLCPLDPFQLESLALPRPAEGYAVQFLGQDRLLDRETGTFLPIRAPALSALFPDFSAALDAALSWQKREGLPLEEPLFAIVPARFDPVFILICIRNGINDPIPGGDGANEVWMGFEVA
ncbi:MAG: hypothetical protein LBI31_02185 [Zoogloeaceae bacterium]|jgi:hypothetical protein|nr:hypothetical protein [Zoogloeaceae bacterium]